MNNFNKLFEAANSLDNSTTATVISGTESPFAYAASNTIEDCIILHFVERIYPAPVLYHLSLVPISLIQSRDEHLELRRDNITNAESISMWQDVLYDMGAAALRYEVCDNYRIAFKSEAENTLDMSITLARKDDKDIVVTVTQGNRHEGLAGVTINGTPISAMSIERLIAKQITSIYSKDTDEAMQLRAMYDFVLFTCNFNYEMKTLLPMLNMSELQENMNAKQFILSYADKFDKFYLRTQDGRTLRKPAISNVDADLLQFKDNMNEDNVWDCSRKVFYSVK